jgi:hypothetical protein
VTRRILRPAAALALGILLAEVTLRLFGVAYPIFYHKVPIIGDALLPGAAGWWIREGRAYIHINSRGMRDREHALEKPQNTVRIAVLGDSYAEAMQVPRERTFWAVAERELSGCGALRDRSVEVLNFGVSGYGTAQELLALRHKAWRFDPDLVLLAFLTGNDVRNNSRELDGGSDRPYFIFRDGKLVLDLRYMEERDYRLDTSALGPLLDFARRCSRLWQLGRALRKAWKRRGEPPPKRPTALGAEPGLDDRVYRPPDGPAWTAAWQVTEALVRQMRTEVQSRGRRLAIVSLSNGIQVHPDPAARRHFAEKLDVADLLYPDRRIERLARDENIPFLMLVPALREWAQTHGLCVHGFRNAVPCGGHWNEYGHQVAGERIAAALCRELLADAARAERP